MTPLLVRLLILDADSGAAARRAAEIGESLGQLRGRDAPGRAQADRGQTAASPTGQLWLRAVQPHPSNGGCHIALHTRSGAAEISGDTRRTCQLRSSRLVPDKEDGPVPPTRR